MKISKVIIGQEVICPDGLGRVTAAKPAVTDGLIVGSVVVETYVNSRSCEWAFHNVELIDPRK